MGEFQCVLNSVDCDKPHKGGSEIQERVQASDSPFTWSICFSVVVFSFTVIPRFLDLLKWFLFVFAYPLLTLLRWDCFYVRLM